MENYIPADSAHLDPRGGSIPDQLTGEPFGSVDHYGAWEISDGVAMRFDPAFSPHARALAEGAFFRRTHAATREAAEAAKAAYTRRRLLLP